MLDSYTEDSFAETHISRLLTKYGIIIVLFEILSRFGITLGMRVMESVFPLQDLMGNSTLYLAGIFLMNIAMNLVVAIILLSDMEANNRLRWLIFATALFSSWTGVIFFLLWEVVKIRSVSSYLASTKVK